MRIIKVVSFLAALAAATSVQAFGIGVRAGTQGVGGDIAWKLAPTLSARIGYAALSWDRDIDTDTVRYDGEVKLSNLSTLLEFSPLGPFRITGGLVFNDNKYDVSGPLSGGRLVGTVKSGKSAAPYIGIGYGNVSGLGINFYVDLGVMYQGSPRANLRADCDSPGSAACTNLNNEVAAEQARLEDELKRLKYFPVLNIGLTIGF